VTDGRPIVKEILVPAGESWRDLAAGRDIPDNHVARVLTFLGSTVREDLVHTSYAGGAHGLLDQEDVADIVERLVLVGVDGAGRALRRRNFEVTAEELVQDVDSIYLCETTIPDRGTLRYVLIDIRPGGDGSPRPYEATLICRRDDFEAVYRHLGIGGSGGAVWRGAGMEDRSSFLELEPSDYAFDSEMLTLLRRETIEFLKGEAASRLREWGVPAKRGIVLWGDPGNGKTLLTRVCARFALEAGMNVVIIEGRRRSRRSFDPSAMGLGDELRVAAARAPALLIFEDIDLHCGTRGESADASGGGREQQKPLAELLDFLDGIEPTEGYVLLASTNDLESLDRALLRSGRIDVEIKVDNPTREQRVTALGKALALGPTPAPSLEGVVDLLEGTSFADVAEVARRFKIAAAAEGCAALDNCLLDAAVSVLRDQRRLGGGDEADLADA